MSYNSGELFSFGSFVLSTRNNILVNSLNYDLCWIHIYLQNVPHFNFFNPLKYCSVQLPSCLLAGNCCTYKFPTIYEQQLVLCRQGRFRFAFVISNQGCWFFVETLSFGFCVVNVECDAYVAMQQLITVQLIAIPCTLKTFLPFPSLILTA